MLLEAYQRAHPSYRQAHEPTPATSPTVRTGTLARPPAGELVPLAHSELFGAFGIVFTSPGAADRGDVVTGHTDDENI